MSYETILVEQKGAVTLITLNRPQALNALNSQVLAELIDAFGAFDADDSQRCAILTGSEKAFAAGADIKEMQSQSFADMYGGNFFAGYDRVTATRKPWIAAVSGFALGGGCELAMMADFIIAGDNAKFGQPEIKLADAEAGHLCAGIVDRYDGAASALQGPRAQRRGDGRVAGEEGAAVVRAEIPFGASRRAVILVPPVLVGSKVKLHTVAFSSTRNAIFSATS